MSKADAEKELLKEGFAYQGKTKGGYDKWYSPDGSKVQIRPNGEVIRTPNSAAISQSGNAGRGWRVDPGTGDVVRPHSAAGEFVK